MTTSRPGKPTKNVPKVTDINTRDIQCFTYVVAISRIKFVETCRINCVPGVGNAAIAAASADCVGGAAIAAASTASASAEIHTLR